VPVSEAPPVHHLHGEEEVDGDVEWISHDLIVHNEHRLPRRCRMYIYIYIYTYVQYICICMVLVHACSPSLWQEVRQGRAGQGKVRSDQVRYYMYVSKAGGEKSSRSGLGGGRTGHLPLVDVDQVGRKDAAPDALDTAAPTTQTNKQTNKHTSKNSEEFRVR